MKENVVGYQIENNYGKFFGFSVIQVILILIGVCCWLFWFACYMSQMNPLIGPILNQRTLIAVKEYWVSTKDQDQKNILKRNNVNIIYIYIYIYIYIIYILLPSSGYQRLVWISNAKIISQSKTTFTNNTRKTRSHYKILHTQRKQWQIHASL